MVTISTFRTFPLAAPLPLASLGIAIADERFRMHNRRIGQPMPPTLLETPPWRLVLLGQNIVHRLHLTEAKRAGADGKPPKKTVQTLGSKQSLSTSL